MSYDAAEFFVAPGESAIAAEAVRLNAMLDEGVLLCVFDRALRLGGMLHLAPAPTCPDPKLVQQTSGFVDRLYEHGARRGSLSGRFVVGGDATGELHQVARVLREYCIAISRVDRIVRRVRATFDPRCGELTIRTMKLARRRKAVGAAR